MSMLSLQNACMLLAFPDHVFPKDYMQLSDVDYCFEHIVARDENVNNGYPEQTVARSGICLVCRLKCLIIIILASNAAQEQIVVPSHSRYI